ncbi:MAG: hypothetical protein OEW39_06135 [Deltaproteobacteria bacterium]|nr:hypothetical protein [Deltaproteobacteria bacterium]
MPSPLEALVWPALAWIGYGALHSLLAAEGVKRRLTARWPLLARRYRLAYILVAVTTLIPPLLLTHALGGAEVWRWPWSPLAGMVHLLAGLGFLWSVSHYNLRAFLGLAPSHTNPSAPDPFAIGFLHRFVRHPIYAFALALIWSRNMDLAQVSTTVVWTGYILLGIPLEEARLLAAYGAVYRQYQHRVPPLLPWPGRWLRAEEARLLLLQAGEVPAGSREPS